MEEEPPFRAPGECVTCLNKSCSPALEYHTVVAGETKLPPTGLSIVIGETLGLGDKGLRLALDDGSHFKIYDLSEGKWTESGSAPRVFQGLRSAVSTFATREDGKLYACGLRDGGISIIRTDNSKLALLRFWRSKNPMTYAVAQVAFLSSKVHIVSIDADRALSLWDLAEGSEPVGYLKDIHSDVATCILPWSVQDRGVGDDARKLEFLVGFRDGVCKKYTVNIQKDSVQSLEAEWIMRIGEESTGPLTCLGWRNFSKLEFIAAHGAYISVCTRERVLFAHQIHMSNITDLKCTRETVVTGSVDGSVKALKISQNGWTLLQRLKAESAVSSVACDPDSHYLGFADAQGKYRVCKVSEGVSSIPASGRRRKSSARSDQAWGGRWEKLMNQHRYRESLLKASSTSPSPDPSEFRTAIRVLESLIECGLAEKAADGLTLEELSLVLCSLTKLLTDPRAFWCQTTVLIILKVVLATNSAWLSRNAEESIISPLYNLQATLAPRLVSSFSAQKNAP